MSESIGINVCIDEPSRLDELQRQLAERHAEVIALGQGLKRVVELTPDEQHEFATVAQAEGVSLSVAREMTQELLGLKRLYWDLRPFRIGRRKGQTPCGLLGLNVPDSNFREFLELMPEELRERLSARQHVA